MDNIHDYRKQSLSNAEESEATNIKLDSLKCSIKVSKANNSSKSESVNEADSQRAGAKLDSLNASRQLKATLNK